MERASGSGLGAALALLVAAPGVVAAQSLPAKPPAAYAEAELRALIEAERSAEAEPILRTRIAALEAAQRGDTADWAANVELLTRILAASKRADEAEPLMKRALAVRERIGEPAPLGRALNAMSAVARERGDSRGAESFARRAIAMLTPLPGREDRLVAAWGNLGLSLDRQSRLPEARAAFEQGIEVGRQRLGDKDPLIATLAALRDQTVARIAFVESAVQKTRTRIDEQARTAGADDPALTADRDSLASMLATLGRDEEAEALALTVYEARLKTGGPEDGQTVAARDALLAVQRRRLLEQLGENRGSEPVAPIAPAGAQIAIDAAKPAADYTETELRALIDAGRLADAERIVPARIAGNETAQRTATAAAATDTELLANILYLRDRSPEAERLMRGALAVREAIGEPKALAVATRRLAIVLNGKEDFRGAEPLARRAIALAAPLAGEGRAQSAAWGTLGDSLAGQRRRSEANVAFQKAIEIGHAALGDADPFVVDMTNSLALNLEEMGNLADAEAIYRRGLATLAAAKGKGSLETARALALVSTNLDRQRKYAEAEAPLLEAIEIRRKFLGADHPDTVRSLSNLVGLLTKAGRLEEAAQVQARVAAARPVGAAASNEVIDLGQQGKILKDQGRLAEAIAVQRRALAVARQRLDPGHAFVATASIELALSLMRQNEKDPEYVAVMREAVANARSARAQAVTGRGAAAGDRALAAALGDRGQPERSASNVYRNALSFNANYATRMRNEEAKLRAESFTIAQDLASTVTGRALTGIAVREALGDGPLARLIRRQQDLAAHVRAADEALTAALSGPPETAAKLRAEIEALGPPLAQADAAVRRAYPDYARLVSPRALTVGEVQRRLGRDEGLLLIVEGVYYTFSFAISKHSVDWSASQTVFGEAQAAIASVRCDVDPLTCASGKSPSAIFDRVSAHEIYKQLIAPLEPALKGVKTLYVSTSGELSNLPFAALLTEAPQGPDSEQALRDAPWLSDRYALVSLPSVASLRAVKAKRAGTGPSRFVGYGAPVLAATGQARAIPADIGPSTEGANVTMADPEQLKTLASLPGTETELKAMAALLGAGDSVIRLGAAATETAVRADPEIGRAQIVAFATHGLLPGELDGFAEPGLVFTPPSAASAADDGVLSASEAAALQLDADLVILSACNTATADGKGGGDALSALARAFLYAGADALLASRWRVGDAVTAALTVETLANAKRNPRAGRAAALQAAMRAVRTGQRADGSALPGWTIEWAHPAAWAPFAVIANSN